MGCFSKKDLYERCIQNAMARHVWAHVRMLFMSRKCLTLYYFLIPYSKYICKHYVHIKGNTLSFLFPNWRKHYLQLKLFTLQAEK